MKIRKGQKNPFSATTGNFNAKQEKKTFDATQNMRHKRERPEL